jgi:DMSO/TMAO reductase YedYZ molybdopterin-dependent catalytic subunit
MTDREQAQRIQLDALPEHPAPALDPDAHVLTVAGDVESPASYSAADLRGLAHRTLDRDFECEEGWVVPDLHWSGVPLATVLERSRPLDDAAWVTLGAGDFDISLSLDEARAALLALELDGAPLTVTHGGPVRLLVPGGACYTSIKWVDRIEVTSQRADTSARRVALLRIGRNPDE